MTVSDVRATTLTQRYHEVRDLTESLAAPLTAEDQVVQSMPDVSPTKWHRAHTTWFFETFLLSHLPGYEPPVPAYAFLFNSYYVSVGERHARPERGLISRPGIAEVTDYRRWVDDAMHRLLGEIVPDRPDLAKLVELGCQHEQQHQELLLMDIMHVFSVNPTRPAYQASAPPESRPSPSLGWVDVAGGIVAIGHQPDDGFSFDNEGPRHQVLVQPHRLADRLVTCGDWLEFIDAGGYSDPLLWLSDGWSIVVGEGWDAPDYWRRTPDGWVVHTLSGERPVDPAEPVVHVSYYEADAFARWAGHRLPTEFEWEATATTADVAGNLLPSGELHPRPASGAGVRQLFGDVWEWTSSAYSPYPGFRPVEGAVGEYNGKFMVDQQVLRGGAAITPGSHVRATYRNFFPARSRWQFAGVRLAGDRS